MKIFSHKQWSVLAIFTSLYADAAFAY